MNKTTRIFIFGIAVALEGTVAALIAIHANVEIFLFLAAICMCASPVSLLAGLSRPVKKGRWGTRLYLCAFLLLAEGLLAGVLSGTKFVGITAYIAMGCFIIVPILLAAGTVMMPKKRRHVEEAPEEEPAPAPERNAPPEEE